MRLALALLLLPTLAHADDDDESSLPPLSVYGFARLDVLADDARMSDVSQPLYVQRMPAAQNDSEMAMTPRMSRVGLAIDNWRLDHHDIMEGEGKLEIDFAGGDGTNALRLRQAYAKVTAAEHVELLAGQTDDLFSPLIPTAQNDTQLLFAGNVGDRRPQLRMVVKNDNLRAGVALATTGTVDRAGFSTSPDRAAPMFEWLVEGKKSFGRIGELVLGLSGHVASEAEMDGTHRGSSSIGMHAFIPILAEIAIQGEGYVGSNDAQIGGGVGQGIASNGHRIGGLGGWIELACAPTKKHLIALGTSADSAGTDDLVMGDRRRNGTVYGVVRYKPVSTLQLAVEYLYWKTSYVDMGNAAANRVDFHLSVFF